VDEISVSRRKSFLLIAPACLRLFFLWESKLVDWKFSPWRDYAQKASVQLFRISDSFSFLSIRIPQSAIRNFGERPR
jgi:hypothetical protein